MDNQFVVTILTPTFNRAHQLENLYHSLCKQSDNRFVWCVVDDGSTDNTAQILEQFSRDAQFPLTFVQKENGGKHTALNMGIGMAETPLIFIVDSDDTLTPQAVETIIKHFETYKDDDSVCGFSFLRTFPNGTINGKPFGQDMWKATYIEARINNHDTLADKAEVYKTACLRQFPFPTFENEKFLGEDVVWIRMARSYQTVHINTAIYIGEYQNDGLTKNRRLHNLQSPKGCTLRAKEHMQRDVCLKMRLKGYLQYLIYGRVAGYSYKKLLDEAPNRLLCLLLAAPARSIRNRWCKQLKN